MHRLLCGGSLIKVRQIPAAAAANKAALGGINAATVSPQLYPHHNQC